MKSRTDKTEESGEGDRQLASALAELREVVPPRSFVAGVMRRLDPPPPPGLWTWLRRSRQVELRLSPLGALAGGCAALALLVVAVQTGARSREPSGSGMKIVSIAATPASHSTPATVPAPPLVQVRFVLQARGAQRVAVAGDFNGWSTDEMLLERTGTDGHFAATVALPAGDHRYMFVVDGEWVTDPAAETRRPDGFGRDNALLRL